MADQDKSTNKQNEDLASDGQVSVPAEQAPQDEITKPVTLGIVPPEVFRSFVDLPSAELSQADQNSELALEKATLLVSSAEETQELVLFPVYPEQVAAQASVTQALPAADSDIPDWLTAYVQTDHFAREEPQADDLSDTSPTPILSGLDNTNGLEDTALITTVVLPDSDSEWISEPDLPPLTAEASVSPELQAIKQALADGNFGQGADLIRQNSTDPALRAEALQALRPYLSLDADRQVLWDIYAELNLADGEA